MGNTAYIRDITSLEQLRVAIARFCEENEIQLLEIDSGIQTRFSKLKLLESYFLRNIDSAKDEFSRAKISLSECESNTYEEEDGSINYPDCGMESENVIDCKRKLESAENKYNSFKKEIRKLELTIEEYRPPKIKYMTVIQFEKEAATSSLKQLINGAEEYISVSSPMINEFANKFGLTELMAKIDPTMTLAATFGVSEIFLLSMFSFIGISGGLFSVSNKGIRGVVTSSYNENGTDHICSELKIEIRGNGNIGKIMSINIPSSLKNEKIGKHLVNNMESTCRANDCKEISGWATSSNISFYKSLNFQTRNEIKGAGAEVYKPLESNFFISQQNAKEAFKNLDLASFINSKNSGMQEINPNYVISPDEMNDVKFWQQHGENQSRYIELIEKYNSCREKLNKDITLDQIRKEDPWTANAYDIFHGTEPIRVLKSGDFFRIDSNGRHRIAAAQIYYLQTGITVPLVAEVLEKR